MKKKFDEYEQEMAHEDFWAHQKRAVIVSQESARLRERITTWDGLLDECNTLQELEVSSTDIHELLDDLEKRFEIAENDILFTHAYDERNALLAIHAGTGGTDAMDWAEMLARMYLRFCERMGWKVDILERLEGGEAGVKTVTFEVRGQKAYGYLKAEHGVHRLVRISPFDAEGMRHTSFALVEVIPDIGDIEEIEINSQDLRIDVFRSSGSGGQGVNTTDSAVRITHLPTGIIVNCQNERSQAQNKETALRYLKAKLHTRAQEEKSKEKKELRGEYHEAAWGNQIRSYVLNPYRLVKDHRTNKETQDVEGVLDGELLPFIEDYLRSSLSFPEKK